MADLNEERMALISVLAEHSPNSRIGRTQVMKFLYFLQVLRDVPLGYRFTLYSYGPFDSDVLADLANSEALGVVDSTVIQFSGGYRYEICPGGNAGWLRERTVQFLKQCRRDVDWVMKNFGTLKSGQLELLSTIVYVDREAADSGEDLSLHDIAEIVQEIKPHFAIGKIMEFAVTLHDEGLLQAAVR
jgi:hypothetical protein